MRPQAPTEDADATRKARQAHTTHLRFSFPDITTADAIARALAPEASQAEVPKTRGDVSAETGVLTVSLHAEDLPSLRATVNSHLRWVDAATKAARIGRGS